MCVCVCVCVCVCACVIQRILDIKTHKDFLQLEFRECQVMQDN